jgi:hypothetical protein
MADTPEDDEKPSPAVIPTPLTTAAQVAGVARETLWSNPTSPLQVAGLARETLMSGVGLFGRISARSFAQGQATASLATVSLNGRILATSRSAQALNLLGLLAGRIEATSAMSTSYFLPLYLAGSIRGTSQLNIGLLLRLAARIGTMSAAASRNLARLLNLSGGRIVSQSRAALFQLPLPFSIGGTIGAKARMQLYDPLHTDPLPLAGRIGAISYARLATPFGQSSAAVTLILG